MWVRIAHLFSLWVFILQDAEWILEMHPTGLLPGVSRSTSGAIHPSVPGIPDRKEKLLRPSGIFLQSPKSEMTARTWPRALGPERRMFLGLRSRWTAWRDDGEKKNVFRMVNGWEEGRRSEAVLNHHLFLGQRIKKTQFVLVYVYEYTESKCRCISDLYLESGGVRGHTWSVPADL